MYLIKWPLATSSKGQLHSVTASCNLNCVPMQSVALHALNRNCTPCYVLATACVVIETIITLHHIFERGDSKQD